MGEGREYDLEDRTLVFARSVRKFIGRLDMDVANFEDAKQLVRSSGSVGANYIEANDGLSKKDFLYRIKVSRKEAKESRYWLSLIETFENEKLEIERKELRQEANELMLIRSHLTKFKVASVSNFFTSCLGLHIMSVQNLFRISSFRASVLFHPKYF